MKILFFSSDNYTRDFLNQAKGKSKYRFSFSDARLNADTAYLAQGYTIISCSIYDELNATTLKILSKLGVKLVALRSAGYNNVDIDTARRLKITIAYVPTYSPYSVAEHTVALILALNRKTHKAYLRIREGNFSLRSLIGFDLHDTTVGIIGTGRIGSAFASIMRGFGCKLLGYDKQINQECLALGVTYVPLPKLLSQVAIISLHCPLLPQTHHIINSSSIKLMRSGVMLINTSRGALVDTQAVIKGLKTGKIGYLGLDVYEAEHNLFSSDLSASIIEDDTFARLQTFPNVLITSHQGFLTKQAYTDIANITMENIKSFIKTGQTTYQVS